LYLLNIYALKPCLYGPFGAPHGSGCVEGDCRATGALSRAFNGVNTAALKETVEYPGEPKSVDLTVYFCYSRSQLRVYLRARRHTLKPTQGFGESTPGLCSGKRGVPILASLLDIRTLSVVMGATVLVLGLCLAYSAVKRKSCSGFGSWPRVSNRCSLFFSCFRVIVREIQPQAAIQMIRFWPSSGNMASVLLCPGRTQRMNWPMPCG